MDASRTLAGDERALALERIAVWLVVLAVVAAVAGSVAYMGEEWRRDAPDADFDVAFDAETGTVTVEHAGGDPIRDRTTTRLSVVLVDASGGTNESVVWASDRGGLSKRGTGYPVTEGESLTVDDPSVDADGDGSYHDAGASVGFHLESGDSVRVVWEGSLRGGSDRTVALANATL